jgi:hypothetical protein
MILKRYIYIFIVFISLCSYAQKKVTLYSQEHKIYPKISIPLSADVLLNSVANKFNENFKNVTGQYLKIERSDEINNNYNYIILRVDTAQKESYCIFKKDRNITIKGTSDQNLVFGINAFFKKYTALNFEAKVKKGIENTVLNELDIPDTFNHCSSPDFKYREPYFSSNFNSEFRAWNKTNYLELEWGIWGHNISKVLKEYNLPESAYAKLGNKRVKNQYCFTSDSLFKFLNEKIGDIYASDHALNKYMILPNDNTIVCECDKCKAVGNTTKDAAPAVFNFLNSLARNHEKLSFFTTAYLTVKEIPPFKAASNVGLFYSTIAIQKGVPLEDTKDFKVFKYDIKKWRKYLENVYIWDYAVNFDNYFDMYPSLKVTQKNLKLYKELGINGVFLHGSEYQYSTFQDLKATIFAKLLWDTDINVDEEISTYFHEKFPTKLADVLTKYYLSINNSFLANKKELSIYSGIEQSVKKYLDPKVFFSFYDKFDSITERNKYDIDFLKIATALTFLKLEVMVDNGIGDYGFATINNNEEIIVKKEVTKLLDKLTTFSKSANLKIYNEVKYEIDEYVKSWKKSIYKYHKRKHYFYKKPFEILSKLDEDYTDTTVLNDGTFGLNAYNTNWHISSIDDLTLKIEKKHIKKSKKITFSFLQNIKHAIYYPSVIEILDINYNLIKQISIPINKASLAKKEVSINLPSKFDDKQLPNIFIVKINKHNISGKNALACDEIIFN